MEVFLPLLCYNQTCNANFMLAVVSLIQKFQELNIKITIYPIFFESLVSRARNAAVAHFMASTATHLFFIDSDILFNPNDVVKLLKENKPVIGGIYPKKYLKSQSGSFHVEFTANGKVGLEEHLCTLDYIPAGFLCINRETIQTLMDKKPELKYTNNIDGYQSEQAAPYFFDLFQTKIDENNHYLSEDYGFCSLLKETQIPIYAYPNITLGHVGHFNYIGNFQELITAQVNAQQASAQQASAQTPPTLENIQEENETLNE